jgi:chemotaxis protein MotB
MAVARRKKRAHHQEEHDNEERWLVSYADMMTLLLALFMVLFSISSVNTSKFEALQRSLQDAFSGKILSGGKAVMETGNNEKTQQEAAQPPVPALMPLVAVNAEASTGATAKPATAQQDAAAQEQEDLQRLKARIDKLVDRQGLHGRVKTTVRRRGLVVELLTDKVFFDSGSAELKLASHGLLARIGQIIDGERRHPVVVEGHTDSQPIHDGIYPSNWELSGARASSVVRTFIGAGVLPRRMLTVGYASSHPIDTNTSAGGRSRNRRVDVVLSRINPMPTTGGRRP